VSAEEFRNALRDRLGGTGQRPRLNLKPLTPEQQARSSANQQVAREAEKVQKDIQADFFSQFDAARNTMTLDFKWSASKHADELGATAQQLEAFVGRAVKGIGAGKLTFDPQGQNGPGSFRFSIRLADAMEFAQGLTLKTAGGTYKSIMGEVVPGTQTIVIFHIL
jgi:hypothetical protein